MTTDDGVAPDYIALTVEMVSAFVSRNAIPVPELHGLIGSVHATLIRLSGAAAPVKVEAPTPAVPVKRSLMPDFIVCLEDGKKFKSLKRHLRTRYDMTPKQYRAKWNLAADYPMVAPNYAAARSELARNMGLGQKRRKARAKAPVEAEAPPAPRPRRAGASGGA